MPRYRCVLTPDVADSELIAMLPAQAMRGGLATGATSPAFEVAYEIDAPDIASVELWLAERSIPASSVSALEEIAADA